MKQSTLDIVIHNIECALCTDGRKDVVVTHRSGFYELGLSSLLLTELTDDLNQRFQDVLDVSDFFDQPDILALSIEIDRRLAETLVA